MKFLVGLFTLIAIGLLTFWLLGWAIYRIFFHGGQYEIDLADLCVCGHSASDHKPIAGLSIDDYCRCSESCWCEIYIPDPDGAVFDQCVRSSTRGVRSYVQP